MKNVRHVILIGNYPPDNQKSMNRFLQMMAEGIASEGRTSEAVYPTVFFGKFVKNTLSGAGKWIAYIDKWIVFPFLLMVKRMTSVWSRPETCFHICDHSNAMYVTFLPRKRTVVTCHDVLAIRGAMGYRDAYCEASGTGKILQRWILNSLRKSYKTAFVSETTRRQMLELCNLKEFTSPERKPVILNALNADFRLLDRDTIRQMMTELPALMNTPFILHVGSALPRKNRKLLPGMLKALDGRWNGVVCLAGEAPDADLVSEIARLNLNNRFISIENPDHKTLNLLYNAAEALVFPSFSEGFGWPVTEAQACGTPVIVSSIQPMPEVGGDAAIAADPYSPEDFAAGFLTLLDAEERNRRIQAGFQNLTRFERKTMMKKYIQLYEL